MGFLRGSSSMSSGMQIPHPFSIQIHANDNGFPLKPIILHGFSVSFHLFIFFLLSLFYLCKRPTKERLEINRFFYYKTTLFSSLGLGLFYLVLSLHFYIWHVHGFWSDENIVTFLDLVVRVFVWVAISCYLRFVDKYPTFLSIWWGLFLAISFSFLVVDWIWYRKLGIMTTNLWVIDFGSLVGGVIINCAGIFGKRSEEEKANLHDRLLNGGNFDESCNRNDNGSESIFENAGFFSLLTFSWMGPLLSVGHQKTLDLEDVPQLAQSDSVNGVYPVFKNKLESYTGSDCRSGNDESSACRISTYKLAKALVFSTWDQVMSTAIYALVYTIATYVGPYLIAFFVQYLNGTRMFASEGYILVVAFIVAKLFECLSQRHWFFRLQQAGIRVRSSLVAMIYQKGLTLSSHSKQGHTSGEIINLMSVDADRIGLFSWYMHDLWMVPIQVGLALAILYSSLGLASLAALAATIAVMLANFPLGSIQERYQKKLMEAKDIRMKTTSEILKNMRILKLQAWEMKFLSKIFELRKEEASWLRKYVYTLAMITFTFWGAPTFVAVVTFGACMIMGIPLESGKVLSALATFRVLQEPIYNLPDTISMVIQTKVSLDRISSFLCLEDLPTDVVQKLPRGNSEAAVEVSNGNFSWDPSSEIPTLRDLNFKALHGTRVAVCGTVGSGKSSLLSCILGEVPKLSGTIKLCGTTAYVAQSPWIQSGKIQDTILFGKEMDIEKYENILEACSLKKDLEILPFGDQT
ncbi:ABC transporter C family member 3-like, partial [Asparagus officinalis]|uniref:ABC transporter C family member 3-like n=1 Tax=Asparagus officinalis TaxID=4686 RepID=UPI00098E0D38